MTVRFRSSEGIDAIECGSKSGGKVQFTGVLVWSECCRESSAAGGACRRRGASGVALGRERVLRAGGLGAREPFWDGRNGAWSRLTRGFQEGSGAGVRAGLGYMEKGVPSRLYRRVPEGLGRGLGNLTERLTESLTPDLTDHLTAGLTK